MRSMEGIVRKLHRSNPQVEICLVYLPGGEDFEKLLAGEASNGMTLHELVAEHYALPSVCPSFEAARMEHDGRMVHRAPKTPDDLTPKGKLIFTNDGSHPTPKGHAVWAFVVQKGLDQMRDLGKPGEHPLPSPLIEDHWANATTLPLGDRALLGGTWSQLTAKTGPTVAVEGRSAYDDVPVIFRTDHAGSGLTLRFRGTSIGLKKMTTPDSGVVSIQIDKEPPVKQSLFSFYSKSFSYGGKILPALPEGEHTITWTLVSERPDKQVILTSKNRPGERKRYYRPPRQIRWSLVFGRGSSACGRNPALQAISAWLVRVRFSSRLP